MCEERAAFGKGGIAEKVVPHATVLDVHSRPFIPLCSHRKVPNRLIFTATLAETC